jgi:hypothetical protein
LTSAQCSFAYSKDICGERDAALGIQLWNGDFIVGGGGGCDANPEMPVLAKLNCKGETIWYKTFPDYIGGIGTILQLDSNTIIVTSGTTIPYILKVNTDDGSVIMSIKNYLPLHDSVIVDLLGWSNFLLIDKHLYLSMGTTHPLYPDLFYIIKMDIYTLKVNWVKECRQPNMINNERVIINQLLFYGIDEIGIAGYVLNSKKILIQIIDTSGNFKRILYPFDSIDSTLRPSILHRTSQSQNKKINMVLRYVGSSNTKLAVLDTSGSIIKYQSYDDVSHFIETKGGGYAVCGRNDLIRKLDSNFQTIYQVKSKWPGSDFYYINEAQDGGLFTTGMAGIFATDGDMAFIKAEPHGGINSVQEVQDLAAQIQTSPNPATTQVHITSPVKLESYTISNTSGTQLQSGVLENDNNIDISQLPQGLYFLQLQLENGQSVTKKLVRN